MKIIEIQDYAIKIEDFMFPLKSKHGCESIFTGYVRNNIDGKSVKYMEYTCHKNLALKTMNEIVEEVVELWGKSLDIIFIHRVGRLNISELSVFISVRAAHRKDAFAASRYLIEELKKRVPIWKKEFYSDGEYEWLDGVAL